MLEAYSEDGLRFEVRPAPLARGADTQHQALAGGRRLLVYLGGGEEELRIKDLDSGEERPLRIEGGCGPEVTCVDPVLAPLPDGSLRLYYTAAPRGGDPADSALTTHVRSARSEDGGVTWVREPGTGAAARGWWTRTWWRCPAGAGGSTARPPSGTARASRGSRW